MSDRSAPNANRWAPEDSDEELNRCVPKVMGMTEVSEKLAVDPKNLGKVANLPPEFQTIKAGRLWRADVINRFAKARAAKKKG